MVTSADGKTLYVETAGYHDHGLTAIDLASKTVAATLPLRKLLAGLAYDAKDNLVYLAGGGARGADARPSRPFCRHDAR
jgi:DNA-binding beta-propeller fold protein YncE